MDHVDWMSTWDQDDFNSNRSYTSAFRRFQSSAEAVFVIYSVNLYRTLDQDGHETPRTLNLPLRLRYVKLSPTFTWRRIPLPLRPSCFASPRPFSLYPSLSLAVLPFHRTSVILLAIRLLHWRRPTLPMTVIKFSDQADCYSVSWMPLRSVAAEKVFFFLR